MAGPEPFRSELLLGEDHVELNEIATRGVGDRISIALSRGKHPKGYPSVDPNEDAVAAATNGTATLLAVADAHFGFVSARAAVQIIHRHARQLLDDDPVAAIRRSLVISREAIADALEAADPEHSGSRTTLVVAILAGTRLHVGGVGDSQAAIVSGGRSRALLEPLGFLGPESDVARAGFAETDVDHGSWVVIATDGLFDFLGRDWPAKLERITADSQPVEAAQGAVEAAFAGGAGDNIALALTRVGG